MAGQGCARTRTLAEQPETIIQTSGNFIHRQPLQPRGRQLDCQGDAVKLAANTGDRYSVMVCQSKGWLCGARTFDKKSHRFILLQHLFYAEWVKFCFLPRRRQRGDGPFDFALNAQRLAAGGQDMELWATTQKC